MNNTIANPLGYEKTGKLIKQFAIPAIISMLVSSLYNIVDQIFIGQGVGLLGNSATNIALPVTTICTAVALLMGMGSAANFNLRSGAGKQDDAIKYMGNGLLMLILTGLAILVIVTVFLTPLLYCFGSTEDVFPYAFTYTGIIAIGAPFQTLTTGGGHLIRADGSPKISMICMLTGAIINTILDPIFIFACGFGIAGGAWATVIGQAVSGIIVLVYFSRLSKVKLKKEHFRVNGKRLANTAALGCSLCANQVCILAVQIVLNNVLKTYGQESIYGADIPIAVVGIITKVNMIFLSICIGTSQGCQPIFGFNYGAKNYDRVKETYKTAAKIVIVSGIIFFALFQLCPRAIISIFGTGSEEYYIFAEKFFRAFMLLTFINGLQPISSGFFSSIGKARLGMLLAITRQAVFLIPLVLIFPIFFGIDGVTYAGPIADAVAALLAIIFTKNEFKIMNKLQAQNAETNA